MNVINLVLYGRQACHLCEEMLNALREMDQSGIFKVEIVDIDTDPNLQKKYAARIPLLAVADTGEIVAEYFLDADKINLLLEHSSV